MALKCPRTNTALKEISIDGIKVDVSEKCGGIWLDNLEIKKLDEAKETAGDKLADMLEQYVNPKTDLEKRIKCPKCPDSLMMRHFYSAKRAFQVDTCPTCGGIWLDPGELTHLRSLFKTEEEREKYGKEFAREVTEGAFKPLLDKAQKDLESAQSIAKALRFICPSYYIKGKQDWGAF